MDELKKFSSPRVVVATSSDLTPSFALELFLQWAPDPANRVIFIDRSRPRALARQLLENPTVGTLTITVQFDWLTLLLASCDFFSAFYSRSA